jgi:hypothetical protein
MFDFPDKMKRVFKDPEMQQCFEEQGYVTVQFYTENEVSELDKLYSNLHPKEETGFYPSTFSKDKNYRQTADEEIRRIGNRTISDVLENHKVVCGSFIVKYPGNESEMGVHRDERCHLCVAKKPSNFPYISRSNHSQYLPRCKCGDYKLYDSFVLKSWGGGHF